MALRSSSPYEYGYILSGQRIDNLEDLENWALHKEKGSLVIVKERKSLEQLMRYMDNQ